MEVNNGIQVKTDIEKLKKEKMMALVHLGKQMHKLIRDGVITDEANILFSQKIAKIDLDIYTTSGVRVPLKEEGICPDCGELLEDPIAVFCGRCGTNILNFYQSDITACEICGQLIQQEANYCSICGVKRVQGDN